MSLKGVCQTPWGHRSPTVSWHIFHHSRFCFIPQFNLFPVSNPWLLTPPFVELLNDFMLYGLFMSWSHCFLFRVRWFVWVLHFPFYFETLPPVFVLFYSLHLSVPMCFTCLQLPLPPLCMGFPLSLSGVHVSVLLTIIGPRCHFACPGVLDLQFIYLPSSEERLFN